MMPTPGHTLETPTFPDACVRRYRFVEQLEPDQTALRAFTDPRPHKAICTASTHVGPNELFEDVADGFTLVVMPSQPHDSLRQSDAYLHWVGETNSPTTALPIAITMQGAQIYWGPQRVILVAAPERIELYALALLDFCYHERALRQIEDAIRNNWEQLQADTPTAHHVTTFDRGHFEEIAEQTEQALQQRLQLARLEPHFYGPRPRLGPLANQLTERLRERTRTEDRMEVVARQLEIIVQTYEMASQRISDFKLARQSRALEWGILVLLAAEGVLLLLDLLWNLEKG